MSRSRKKNPFSLIAGMKPSSRRNIKRQVNRSFRRRLNQGVFDEDLKMNKFHKKESDCAYCYDFISFWSSPEDCGTSFEKYFVRK